MTKEKNIWVFLIFILSGIVLGGLLGVLAEKVSWLWWLSYGKEFGITEPIVFDLSVLKITFGLDSKIIFKQFSKEYSETYLTHVTFKFFPISLRGKTVSLYTMVLLTTVVCERFGTNIISPPLINLK